MKKFFAIIALATALFACIVEESQARCRGGRGGLLSRLRGGGCR
jgi:hypothetical protein